MCTILRLFEFTHGGLGNCTEILWMVNECIERKLTKMSNNRIMMKCVPVLSVTN